MKKMLVLGLVAVVSGCGSMKSGVADNGFVALFGGTSFNGWTQKGGEAKYTIENGEIVGTTVPKAQNSFMCTKKCYGDFILELDFKVDPKLNSGIQIRSAAYEKDETVKIGEKTKKFEAGRVHGYQVEIDPSERAYSGGIYDEARRGWLNDLKENEAARKAFKQSEWNHFKVECRGSSIKTWINGVPAADLQDDMTATGFIALQVHGVGKSVEKIGAQVRWRNIKIKEL
ncbi:MAG: DUF1080 domain-containing protein [Kiritimatiellales bacterium]|nr:DUF1080 domain-containing protein [Kiritimatiellales bacterium]